MYIQMKEKSFGKVDDIYNTGSNDIYVVKNDLGKQILLPGIPDVIKDVDLSNKSSSNSWINIKVEAKMKFDILTLFPEMFEPLKQSVIGKAVQNEKIEINLINIRDFSNNKHKKVDDTPYGGGSRNGNYARCCV